MVKNLIFDVGDVLIEYRWKEMLMDYGLSEKEAVRVGGEVFGESIWAEELDRGTISLEEVIKKYRTLYPKDGDTIEWFMSHGEQMVVHRPEVWEKIDILKKQGYSVYLLSNYSEELFRRHTEGAAFLELLDGGIVSYQVHMIKPEPEIYETLLKKYGLKPQECLFFDDRAENIQGAQKTGITGIQVLSREMINKVLLQMIDEGRQK